jgi:hypothetical protein
MKKISIKELLETPYDALMKRFPFEIYGMTRDELRSLYKMEMVKQSIKNNKNLLQKENAEYADIIKELEERVRAAEEMKELAINLAKTPQIFKIEPKIPSGNSESVAFMVASDWHIGERVDEEQVNGLNKFTPEIAKTRAINFFSGGQRLWDILRRDTQIKVIVLALLGDFINNTIHDDAKESNLLGNISAIRQAQDLIVSGINFLLEHTDAELKVVCASGNHGRMTDRQRIATEAENSIENYMYHNIASIFKDEKRISFIISEAYHSYINLWNSYTVRLHHGHFIKYGGGIGGIYIPVNKAIDQWNKEKLHERVDLDVFGHFHQYIDAGNFVSNGSLIGYNSYAISIKAPYERPQQAFFLVNKKYASKTMVTPIIV